MSKFSIHFLSGTASSTPLVSPPWPGALDGALQGTLMQERPGHFNNNPWSWVRLWQETAACWQRPLPSPAPGLSHSCSPVQKRGFFFLLLSLGFASLSHEPNKPRTRWIYHVCQHMEPTQEGLAHRCVSLHNTSCKNTHCQSHMEQRFPSLP